MKTIILNFLFIVILFCSYGQNPIQENINKYNFKDGKNYTYHSNGKVKLELNLKNGKLHGKVFGYYNNGKIYSKENYFYGTLHGALTIYDRRGRVYMFSVFKTDTLQLYRIKFYYFNDTVKSKHEWERRNNFSDSLKDIYKESINTFPFDNFKYSPSSISGLVKGFYRNGKLKYSGQYFNNKPVGIWYSYNKYGILKKKKDYN